MSDSQQAQPAAQMPASPEVVPLGAAPTSNPSLPGRGISEGNPSLPERGDDEIEALLAFEPVPRQFKARGGWTPELQRQFIARLAVHGSPGKACEELGKHRTGANVLCKSPGSDSFRAAWDAAVALAEKRIAEQRRKERAAPASLPPPSIDRRRRQPPTDLDWEGNAPLPGQVMNENGLWEDEANYLRRADEAKDSISRKLLAARRLYLMSISVCGGKRAAFEILTELPIDWERAEKLQPQEFEPFERPNSRNHDILLTAENGWMGDFVHGPDKKAELRRMLNEYRAEQGLPPIEEEEEA